jgi:hypothetical protein
VECECCDGLIVLELPVKHTGKDGTVTSARAGRKSLVVSSALRAKELSNGRLRSLDKIHHFWNMNLKRLKNHVVRVLLKGG